DTPDKILVLARGAIRAPVQFFRLDNDTASCCHAADCPANDLPGRPAADAMLICPHRPWGEMGLVDNYRTIRERTDYSAESVRKLLGRYRGPDREWLLGIQPRLTPDDC
ncbi:MAG: hypothetical protein LC799_01080, partial [Actinobacteria bacterium]|nr:hypothetical protein [Actinomycetota bacterium]